MKTNYLRIFTLVFLMCLLPSFAFATDNVGKQILLPEDLTEVYTPDESADDNDELFDGYIKQEMRVEAANNSRKSGALRSIGLSGANRTVYNILKAEVKRVADGERASTVFEVSLEDLGLGKNGWSASELGVSAIKEDGYITDEAVDAVFEAIGFDLRTVIDSLLANCPYDLYWYDKTAFTSMGGLRFSYWTDKESEEHIALSSGLTFYFPVSEGYSAGEYTVDTTNGERVQHAVNKAHSIVEEYSSSSDYNKLDSYRAVICELVEYDHSAAANEDTPYGDSWQLISVFDEDTTTNVVCEGYAKAFKYLCDLSGFDSDDISCITVTGTMDGGNGAGNHMWNIVTMEDRKNYLVDITNCDEGTIGAPNLLFLSCCSYGDAQSSYTIQLTGRNIVYCYGSGMYELYDSDSLILSDSPYEIEANDHDYGNWTVTEEPTCTEKGSKEKVCSSCGDKVVKEIPASGHKFSAWTVKKAATEIAAGEKTRTCSVCGKAEKQTIAMLKPTLPAVSITKPAAAKKSATVKWKKVSKANQKKIASIQIQYSTDKTFKTGVKTVTAKKSAASKKITKLASKKTYYIRIRAYKSSGGAVHVSKWSAVKSVKAK